MAKQNRVLVIAAESLNDYAGYIARGEMVPNHTPPYASYWFGGMARELRNLRGTSWEALLDPFARHLFQQAATV